ncbi:hypothetical protein G6F24_018039 [Rhizopus arrhizus]|nr:hypothetical protein G6F24_018039 [Rhizopus arrhizus]
MRNVHAQHARRLQHQITQTQFHRHVGQPRAQFAVQPLAGIIGDPPLPVVGGRGGLRRHAAFRDRLEVRSAHLPSNPFKALSTAAPFLPLPVTASRSLFSRLRLRMLPIASFHITV